MESFVEAEKTSTAKIKSVRLRSPDKNRLSMTSGNSDLASAIACDFELLKLEMKDGPRRGTWSVATARVAEQPVKFNKSQNSGRYCIVTSS